MASAAPLNMFFALPEGGELGLNVSRFDERQRRLRLRLAKTASCWDYAPLIDKLNTEQGAASCLRDVSPQLGASAAIFVSFIHGDPTLDSYRFILACDPAFCQEYQQRFWYLNDPCLIYAVSNTLPIRLNHLPIATAAQRTISDSAALYGFASGLIVPAHGARNSSRIGCLFLGSSDPNKFSLNQHYEAVRPLARLLAIELHEFISGCVRRDLLESAKLSADDLVLLQMQRDGFQSKHMARQLDVTPAAIDTRFKRLNSKLGVTTRKQAAELAIAHGLL